MSQGGEHLENAPWTQVRRFTGPVVIAHGDGHRFTVDQPLPVPHITRLQVPGSQKVGWVRVIVRPGSPPAFTFERHVVPKWKYW